MKKAEDPVDAASDELYLDSDVSADNESWRQIARNFSIKPSHLKLSKLGLDELRDGYHMVKPKEIRSWEQLQDSFAFPDSMKPSIEHRKAELYRMFPDINYDFDAADLWEAFLEQRRIEMTSSDSGEEADEEPEPKKGKTSPVKGAKGASVDSDEDSPIQPPSPPVIIISVPRGDTTLCWRRRRRCGAVAIHPPCGRCATVPSMRC